MQKVGSAPDLLDLDLVVDQDAEPIDFDEALAEFLLKVVERRLAAKAETEQQAG
jgi:hypothetical protein